MAGRMFVMKLNGCKAQTIAQTLRRSIKTSACLCEDTWFSKILPRPVETARESHSRMLSDKKIIYELQTDNVKPGSLDTYLKNYENYVKGVEQKDLSVELCGSWTVEVGDKDQCLHLWRHNGGYAAIDNLRKELTTDKDISSLVTERSKLLRQRVNQYLLLFSYWPSVTKRTGDNLYEIRSYFLKPGTMSEWGNSWAKGIKYRQTNDEAFGGFFSHVGTLYNVQHIWCYENMAMRKAARESVWAEDAWTDVIANTVPLIQSYQSRILYPTSFSPSK